MKFEALQNLEVFLVGAELQEKILTAQILVTQSPKKLAGQQVTLVEPRNPRGITITATLPKDLSEIYTKANLTNASMENCANKNG